MSPRAIFPHLGQVATMCFFRLRTREEQAQDDAPGLAGLLELVDGVDQAHALQLADGVAGPRGDMTDVEATRHCYDYHRAQH